MGIFRYDSELMMSISRATDYIILNVLCFLCSMPIITLGAAVTAKYYVSMKLVRGEEPSIFKAYFKSFKENFKQATLVWLLSIALILFFAMDWYLIMVNAKGEVAFYFKIALFIMSVVCVMSIVCIFPIIARFHVTMKEAIRSAVLFSIIHFPKMILVILSIIAPYYIGSHYMNYFLGIWFFCTGFSLYYVSKMYVKAFAKLEGNKEGSKEKEDMQGEAEANEFDSENRTDSEVEQEETVENKKTEEEAVQEETAESKKAEEEAVQEETVESKEGRKSRDTKRNNRK